MTTTLLFNRTDLLYDIAAQGFVIADLLPRDETNKSLHIADVVQDGNVDIVTRKMNLAYQKCKELLRAWAKTAPVDGETISNTFTESDQYQIVLTYPSNVSITTIELLSTLIHEYIVDRALFEWLSTNNREEMSIWYDKYTKLEKDISTCMNARGGATYRPGWPY